MSRLERYWYSRNPIAILLWPLGWLFCVVVTVRRLAYRWGIFTTERLPVPVIIVGNISVGGNGKTPLVIHLAEMLRRADYRPGIVTRGYGGETKTWPQRVKADSDPGEVGDEPVLLARRCSCPVVADPDRVTAARKLVDDHDCNVIVADDGLQHYRLARDLEIAVVDSSRLGNGACLPAGPLREPRFRLKQVDFIVTNGEAPQGTYPMTLSGTRAINLTDPQVSCALDSFRYEQVHAVAGIGNPSRFFALLEGHGIPIEHHEFPDHHRFQESELNFGNGQPVLMTEKDAVKCQVFAREYFWYVPVDVRLDPEFDRQILTRLAAVTDGV